MPYLKPDGTATGGWTIVPSGTLHGVLGDDSDSTYVVAAGGNVEASLGNPAGAVDTAAAVTLRARTGFTNSGTSAFRPVIALYEGATLRASFEAVGLTSIAWQSYTLTGGEKAAISDWNALSVRLTSGWSTGSTDFDLEGRVYEVDLEYSLSSAGRRSQLPALGVG